MSRVRLIPFACMAAAIIILGGVCGIQLRHLTDPPAAVPGPAATCEEIATCRAAELGEGCACVELDREDGFGCPVTVIVCRGGDR